MRIPESYLFNTNEPQRYPFPRDADGEWDYTRFEPAFFGHLEHRIEQLAALGIESDLILFTPTTAGGSVRCPPAPTTVTSGT